MPKFCDRNGDGHIQLKKWFSGCRILFCAVLNAKLDVDLWSSIKVKFSIKKTKLWLLGRPFPCPGWLTKLHKICPGFKFQSFKKNLVAKVQTERLYETV